MYRELTNLLPTRRRESLRRDYFLRLGVVVFLGIAALIGAHGILLVPAHVFVEEQISSRERTLAALSVELETKEEREADARLSDLRSDTTYLSHLSLVSAGSEAIRAVLALPRVGIRLRSFTFTPPSEEKEGKMTIAGIADTRDALRRYNLTLSALPFVTKADLPISAYAKESDISFLITLSGALKP